VDSNSSTRAVAVTCGALAAVVSLAFAAFTGHMWEDYFITFRASLNLATGNGLVFEPGERVHTFTSPLGTLLPALFALGGGEGVEIRALWMLRVLSAVALAGALWIVVRQLQRDSLSRVTIAVVAACVILDAKVVDFAMNGMETGLVVFLTIFTWYALVSGARVWPIALAFAGLQWTRPDGFVFFGALAAAWIAFGSGDDGLDRRTRTLMVLRGGALGGLIYLPWVVFAWSYYGSPIPHTILAKAQAASALQVIERLAAYPLRLLVGDTPLHDIYMPAYYYLGGWPAAATAWSRVLATVAALTWAWPRVARPGRIASAALFLGGFYVNYIPNFAWYYPAWAALGWVSFGYLVHALANGVASTVPRATVWAGATAVLLLQVGTFGSVAWQMRTQQSLVELGVRREVGLWLASNAESDDTVFLECLGYIGYYSGLKMLDWPGLASREVLAARRGGADSFPGVVPVLRPDWLVLRPREVDMVFAATPELRDSYRRVRTFDQRAAVDAVGFLPGRGYLEYDATFVVYQRAGD
jgi:hypothetical protein